MTKAQGMETEEAKLTHPVSQIMLLGVILMPIIFVWYLPRVGPERRLRWAGIAWIAPSLLMWISTLAVLNIGDELRETSAKKPSLATVQAAPPKVAEMSTDLPPSKKAEADYIELLELAGDDPDGDIFTRDEGDPRATWEAGLMTMGTTAKFYGDGAQYALADLGRSKQRDFKAKVGRMQSDAFPKLRLEYGKDLAQRLWEHDVEVSVTGAGNSTLRLTGFWFAANRNIKQIAETAHPDALALRFKQMEFRSNKFSDTTSYEIKSLPDSQLATYSYNQWTPVD